MVVKPVEKPVQITGWMTIDRVTNHYAGILDDLRTLIREDFDEDVEEAITWVIGRSDNIVDRQLNFEEFKSLICDRQHWNEYLDFLSWYRQLNRYAQLISKGNEAASNTDLEETREW